jgi:large subunit ribosomal protein L33
LVAGSRACVGWDRPHISGTPSSFDDGVGLSRRFAFLSQGRLRLACLESEIDMAKKKSMAREYVWLQCTETGDLNYRTEINVKGGIAEKLKEGFMKYSPRLRRHSKHKIKRK